MSNLQYRQSIIQEKRKKTPWRDFVMEICSWYPVNLYKNNGIISRYPITGREGVVKGKLDFDRENYFQNENIAIENFFLQLFNVRLKTEKKALPDWYENENADFVDCAFGIKNGYLSFGIGINAENVVYSMACRNDITNIYNSVGINTGCNNIYSSSFVSNSYNIFYSKNIHDCSCIWNSVNLMGCSECINCESLSNSSYCINNVQYEKGDYQTRKIKYLNQKNINCKENSMSVFASENVEGSGAIKSSNVENGYLISEMHNCRNTVLGFGNSSFLYDGIQVGHNSADFYGACDVGTNSSYIYCSSRVGDSSFIYYSINLESCSFCLGCIGLKNKSYCILNKQYTKEERYTKVDEIFGQMHADGALGDFFPATMNPFYFNDTAAYLIDPTFTKEEVTAKGYLRRDEPIKVDIPAGVQTVSVRDLDKYEGRTVGTHGNASEQKRTIDDEILKKVILDEQGNAYRIIPMELEFLRKYELPLPRKHWLDRMKENFRIS